MKKSNKTPGKKFISQAVREAILLFSFSISLYIYLTLTTYNSEDSSWINSSSLEIKNLGGLFGSYLSETLYFIFGIAAFLIPLIIIFASVLFYNKVRDPDDSNIFLRYIGYIFFLLTACALLSIHNVSSTLNAGPGGLLGDFTASILVNNFNVVGSTILLVTFFVIGTTLWLKLSWIYILEIPGHWKRIGTGDWVRYTEDT